MLSDVIECLLAVVCISDSFNMNAPKSMFTNFIKPFYQQYISFEELPENVLRGRMISHACRGFQISSENGEFRGELNGFGDWPFDFFTVLVHDVILANAKERVSVIYQALDALDGDPTFLPRNCNCGTTVWRT